MYKKGDAYLHLGGEATPASSPPASDLAPPPLSDLTPEGWDLNPATAPAASLGPASVGNPELPLLRLTPEAFLPKTLLKISSGSVALLDLGSSATCPVAAASPAALNLSMSCFKALAMS